MEKNRKILQRKKIQKRVSFDKVWKDGAWCEVAVDNVDFADLVNYEDLPN